MANFKKCVTPPLLPISVFEVFCCIIHHRHSVTEFRRIGHYVDTGNVHVHIPGKLIELHSIGPKNALFSMKTIFSAVFAGQVVIVNNLEDVNSASEASLLPLECSSMG